MFLILLVWLFQASKLCIQFTWLSKSCDLQVIVITQEDVITDQQQGPRSRGLRGLPPPPPQINFAAKSTF